MIYPTPCNDQQANASTVGPEEVLLQITLAFMVFLGFLVSDEVVDKAALQYRMDGLARGLVDVNSIEIQNANEVGLAEQEYKLLAKWWERKEKGEIDLFRLTALYPLDEAEHKTGPLYETELTTLKESRSFKDLHEEAKRLFGRGAEKILEGEIDRQFEDTAKDFCTDPLRGYRGQENLDRRSKDTDPADEAIIQSGELADGRLQRESMDALREAIRNDFEIQRSRVKAIQLEAFSRHMQAVLNGSPDQSLEDQIRIWEEDDLPMLPGVKDTLKSTTPVLLR
jgi:hypothetical protein